jgi:hypothetical protein
MDQRAPLWRESILIVSCILPLLLLTWIPLMSVAASAKTTIHINGAGTVSNQGTPTVDPTMIVLQKQQLTQQISQQEHTWQNLFWNSVSALLSSILLVVGGIFALFRWFRDRRAEREKQVEERFLAVVKDLGSKDVGTRVGAAILLRTFLQSPYKRFHSQTFDLAVAHLRLRGARPPRPRDAQRLRLRSTDPPPSEDSNSSSLDSLSHALIIVFRESLPLTRKWREKHPLPGASFTVPLWPFLLSLAHYVTQTIGPIENTPVEGRFCVMLARFRLANVIFESRMLDAANIQLDNANLANADLRYAWLEGASLRDAQLNSAKFVKAHLARSHLQKAKLIGANLIGADLTGAHLQNADLTGAHLQNADLTNADLTDADLKGVVGVHTAIVIPGQLSKAKNVPPDQLSLIKQLHSKTLQGAIAEKNSVTPTQPATTSNEVNQELEQKEHAQPQQDTNIQPTHLTTKAVQTSQKPEQKEHVRPETGTDTNKSVQQE